VPCSLEWRFAYADKPDFNDGWCECLASMNNTSLRKTYSEVGEQFGIDANSPHLSHSQVCSELSFRSHVKTDCKDWLFGRGFVSGEEEYSKIDEYDFLGAQGFSLFKVFMFESENGQKIQLPLTYWDRESKQTSKLLSTPSLMLSNYKTPYPLSAQNLIEKYPNATILLTEDLPTAFAINRMFDDRNGEVTTKIIAVSWFGGQEAFKSIDHSPLEGRSVVFIPQASKSSFLFVSKVQEACKEAKVASFSVSQKHIYRFELSGLIGDDQLKNPFEQHLIQNGIVLPECAREIVATLADNTLSLAGFKRLLNAVGLTHEGKETETDIFMSYEPDGEFAPTPKVLDNLINPDDITGICGPREIGKSMDILTRAHSLAYGYGVFGFGIEKPRRVLLLDGEVGQGKMTNRRKRLDHTYIPKVVMTDEKKALLTIISKLSYKLQDGEPSINITNPYWQDKLLGLVPKGGVLFIDNLKTLAPEALNPRSKACEDLIEWFRKLAREKQVSVVFAHHTDLEATKASNNLDVENLAQNLIILSQVSDKGGKVGAQFNGRYEKCKPFPDLNDKKYYAHLPYIAEEPLSGGPWVFEYLDTQKVVPSKRKGQYKGKAKSKHQERRFDKIRGYLSAQDEPVMRNEIAR